MGSFSILHWFIAAGPLLTLAVVIVAIVWIVRRLDHSSDKQGKSEADPVLPVPPVPPVPPVAVAQPLSDAQADKVRWLAAAGYMLVLADAYLTNLMGFYQFYLFGLLICLPTLMPLLIFYLINKSHVQPVVARHVRSASRLYGIYLICSVVDGVLLSVIGITLVHTVLGVGLSLFMLGVLVWLSIRCTQGIVAAFGLAMPVTASGIFGRKSLPAKEGAD